MPAVGCHWKVPYDNLPPPDRPPAPAHIGFRTMPLRTGVAVGFVVSAEYRTGCSMIQNNGREQCVLPRDANRCCLPRDSRASSSFAQAFHFASEHHVRAVAKQVDLHVSCVFFYPPEQGDISWRRCCCAGSLVTLMHTYGLPFIGAYIERRPLNVLPPLCVVLVSTVGSGLIAAKVLGAFVSTSQDMLVVLFHCVLLTCRRYSSDWMHYSISFS